MVQSSTIFGESNRVRTARNNEFGWIFSKLEFYKLFYNSIFSSSHKNIEILNKLIVYIITLFIEINIK